MSLDTSLTILAMAMLTVCGTYRFFDARGGWTLFWAECKRKK
jgi:hypothetical protein